MIKWTFQRGSGPEAVLVGQQTAILAYDLRTPSAAALRHCFIWHMHGPPMITMYAGTARLCNTLHTCLCNTLYTRPYMTRLQPMRTRLAVVPGGTHISEHMTSHRLMYS